MQEIPSSFSVQKFSFFWWGVGAIRSHLRVFQRLAQYSSTTVSRKFTVVSATTRADYPVAILKFRWDLI